MKYYKLGPYIKYVRPQQGDRGSWYKSLKSAVLFTIVMQKGGGYCLKVAVMLDVQLMTVYREVLHKLHLLEPLT